MNTTVQHPLEPLTAEEVQLAVCMLKDIGKVTPTTRFVSVSLKEPAKEVVHGFTGQAADPPRGLRRPVRQRHQLLLRGDALADRRASCCPGSTFPACSRP